MVKAVYRGLLQGQAASTHMSKFVHGHCKLQPDSFLWLKVKMARITRTINEKQREEQLCIYTYVSMIYNYSSHFWEKTKTHVRMSINNQCLSELKTLTSCLPLRDDDSFNSHMRLSWYHAFTRFCYITYWKEIRIYSQIRRDQVHSKFKRKKGSK